jgi:CubicO group peptidase (beta-lactamase class C family)
MQPLTLGRIARDLVVLTGASPGASVAVGRKEDGTWRFGVGSAGRCSLGRPGACLTTTPFDLASVTKPLVAATAARLTQRGDFDLDAPIGSLLEAARHTPSAATPMILLLAHRSGLVAYLPLYRCLVAGRSVCREQMLAEAASALRPDCLGVPADHGFPPLYSDLGYLLVGEALSRASGLELDELLAREVTQPLGLALGSARQWLGAGTGFADEVASTEIVPWRGGELRGVVHDENAWAFAGHGIAGHAGLFGTAEAVARFGAAVLDALTCQSDWLEPEMARELVRPRPGGTLRAGFDGKAPTGSAAGTLAGPATFGHLGFTGTSVWCDPDAGLVTVLLSNRVHPTRAHTAIRQARPEVHDALTAAARSSSVSGPASGPVRGNGEEPDPLETARQSCQFVAEKESASADVEAIH